MIPRLFFLLTISFSVYGCGTSPAADSGRQPLESVDETANREMADQLPGETININTASRDELQHLPHIGATTAQKIIEHRETYGPFKRPEELMQIQGMSDVRFRRIRHLIRVK
jgi:competence ComEA-like helix-hairpin-helix protein